MNTQLLLAKALGKLRFIEMVREIENDQAKQRRENFFIRISVWLRWLGMIGVNVMSFFATGIDQYTFWLGMLISLSLGYLISSIFTTRRAVMIWIRQRMKLDVATCPDKIFEYTLSARETYDKALLELPYIVSNVFSCGLAIRNIIILG